MPGPLTSDDLLRLTAELVDVPSESFAEGPLVDLFEAELTAMAHLVVDRVGDNVVARTALGRELRVVLGGHTDTVPANDNGRSRTEAEVVWGLGAADMKGGLAVMLDLARKHVRPAVDVTYVFYAREEVASELSGLAELMEHRPDLLAGDVAFLGEPTDGAIEAGCQGVLRLEVVLKGVRAHTARAWMGRNAIHRVGALLAVLESYEPRRPVLLGCQFHEALLATHVEGGVAGNVVPDRAVVRIAHRFAPDRTPAEAEAHVRDVLSPVVEEGDQVTVMDVAPAAYPALDHPAVAGIIRRHGLPVTAKLGWTDVARFSAMGVPAVNLGPGDPTLAHTAGEHVTRDSLERTFAALDDLLSNGP